MSRLEELINELCPDGVEYKKVGEVCDTITDYTAAGSFADLAKKVKYRNNPDYAQLIRTTDLKTSFKNKDKFVYVDENAFNYLWRVNLSTESLVLPNVGNCGEVYYVLPDDLPYKNNVLGPNAILVRSSEENNRFLYHVFTSQDFQRKLRKIISPSGQTKFNKTNFKELQIPLPPLSIQSEIVHILDSFTLLTAELTAELTARQKQYAFYRDYLLDFSNEDVIKKIPDIDCSNVEYKRLGDIATAIYRGAGIKRDEVTETGIPCVRYGEIYTTYNVTFNNCVSHTDEDKIQNKKYFEHGDVLFAITGERVEEIAKSCVYLGYDKCLAGGDIVVLKHNQNPKYMAYALSTTNAQSQKSKGKVKSKVVHSSVPAISDIIIPIPPLAEQEKIANMIERFDHLCNDISNGLPAEIEARKKQYEYYRDTLLSFDDKACSHIVKVERERANTH